MTVGLAKELTKGRKLVCWLRVYCPDLVQSVGTIWLTVDLSLQWGLWLLPAGLVLGGTVWSLTEAKQRQHEIRRLEGSLREAEADARDLAVELQASVRPGNLRTKFLLRELLREYGLHDTDCRATLYLFVRGEHFLQVGRYSSDAELSQTARLTHRLDSGMLAEAMREPKFTINGLPQKESTWRQRMVSTFGMREDEVSKLRMRSRSYACLRLPASDSGVRDLESCGVLVLESLAADKMNGELLDRIETHSHLELLTEECRIHQRRAGLKEAVKRGGDVLVVDLP